MLLRLVSPAQSASAGRIVALLGGCPIAVVIALRSVGARARVRPTPPDRRPWPTRRKLPRTTTTASASTDPFLPSNMTTDTGKFIDPKSFPTAQYCGHCHQEAHAEWRQSAHANSFAPPGISSNVNLLNAEKGISSSRHCEGCHDPIAVVAGATHRRRAPQTSRTIRTASPARLPLHPERHTRAAPAATFSANPPSWSMKKASPSTAKSPTKRSSPTSTATPRP